MARTLEPDDRIAHYRIVGPLGAGGMGEVYIARDETLERSVALKILPPALVKSDERLHRFVTEAKSASSLNHPNIVTIYEIGTERVAAAKHGGSIDPAAAPIHFISMELVAGETLDQKIHHERADLRSLVGWLAQAAEGIAKAHASGIVHRDLKPGNIMVSKDGFAKVLDFGLAKLTERTEMSDADRTSAPTEAAVTGAGTVMGTVGYMSPEQVQAKSVDHRSDIFSLGCILYEAATRRRPFAADSAVETMHRILKDKPVPVEEIDPTVPGEVRRVIRRCLAKSPDQRFQSMKDLAIDLREMVESWDTLTPSAPSGTTSGSGALPGVTPTRGGANRIVVAAAILVGLAGVGFGVWSLLRRGAPAAAPAAVNLQDLKLSVLMSRADLAQRDSGVAALSADGRYLAYVTVKDSKSSLFVRQVRTGSDVTVAADNPVLIRSIAFSHDGDFLYYLNVDKDSPNYSALYQVPSLGGTPRKIAFDVDSAPTFSPDGKQVCFRRGVPQKGIDSLQIADVETGEAKELFQIQSPERFATDPDWSPDGKRILIATESPTGGWEARLQTIDVADGQRKVVPGHKWIKISSARHMPDGKAILATAFDGLSGPANQIYRIVWPAGGTLRLTNDFDGYDDLSVASDGASVAAVRSARINNLWVARQKGAWEAQPLTFSSASGSSIFKLAALPGGSVAFAAPEGDVVRLFSIKDDGSERRRLNTSGIFIFRMYYGPRFGLVFSQADIVDGKVGANVWRVDPDGTGLTQLTNSGGEELYALSARGDSLLFWKWQEPKSLYSLKPDGGPPRLIAADNTTRSPSLSPDGSLALFDTFDESGARIMTQTKVAPVDGGEARIAALPIEGFAVGWAADGRGITYIDPERKFSLMRLLYPGDQVETVATADEGIIFNYAWSPDGAHLAYAVRLGHTDRLYVIKPGDRQASMVTEFKTGEIQDLSWAPDAPVLHFLYGTANRDIVLVSGLH